MSAPVMSDSVWLRSKLVRLTKLAITPAASSTSWSVTGKCASEAAVGVSCIDLVLIAVFAWGGSSTPVTTPRKRGELPLRLAAALSCVPQRCDDLGCRHDARELAVEIGQGHCVDLFGRMGVTIGSYPVERPRRVAHQSRVKSEIAGHTCGGFHAMCCRRAADHQRFDAGPAQPASRSVPMKALFTRFTITGS